MRKILIFSLNYFPKYVGGAEVAIKEIVERVDKEKYEFHMLTLRFDSNLPKYEVLHGIHIHRIGFTKKGASISDLRKFPLFLNKYFYQIFAALYAWNFHRKEKFNAIWAMMAHSCGVPAAMFKTFCKLTYASPTLGVIPETGINYILTLQEGDPLEHIEKLAKPFPRFLFPLNWISFFLFKNAFRSADIVQSISTFLQDWAERMGNKNFKTVIPNGVDIKQFTRDFSNEEVLQVKNKLGDSCLRNHVERGRDSETWLVTTSRLVHKNGVDDVISAVAKMPEIHFAILGIGPEEEKYKKLAKELGVESRVKFVGEVKHPELAVYLKACDIFIRPSRSEGMGNSFVEAMSMKMPVVATREGGLSDFIFDGETAFVCEKDNPESIVKAIEKLSTFREGGQLEKVLDTAYAMVLEKYNWDVVAERMEKEVFSKI